MVETKSGDHGRFRAELLRGVRYLGFAVGPEIDGCAEVLAGERGLGIGRPAQLRLCATGQRRRVALADFAAFGKPADLRARLIGYDWGGHGIDLPLATDGTIDVPPLAALTMLAICDAAGAIMCSASVPTSGPLLMPQASERQLRVVDQQGRPLAGARIRVCTRRDPCGREAAVTDAEGMAHVVLESWQDPFANDDAECLLVASLPGHAEGVVGRWHHEPIADWRMVATIEPPLQITLTAAPEQKATITGAALGGRTIGIDVVALAGKNLGVATADYFVPRRYLVALAADGSFTLPPLPPRCKDVRLLLPRIDGMRVLPAPARAAVPASFDLADCEPLALQLVDASGGPASGAQVRLVPFDLQALDVEHAVELVPDRAGRCELLLQHGHWLLVAIDPTGYVVRDLDEWSRDERLTVAMAPKPTMRVRVVDRDGRGIADARFEPDRLQQVMPPRRGIDGLLDEIGNNELSFDLARVRTDADGNAVLRFLPWPGVQSTAHAFRGNGERRSSASLPLVDGKQVVTVRLDR